MIANESTAVNRLVDLATARPLRDSLRYLDLDPVESMTTMAVRRLPHPLWQYAIPATIAIMSGVLIGVLVTRGGGAPARSAAAVSSPGIQPAPVAHSAPVTANPIIAKIDVPPPVVAPVSSLVGVTFETKPAGATVTLVDNGKPSYIGTTPVQATIDATHRYDIVYTLDGYATRVTPLDPSATHHAEARLDELVKPDPDRRAMSQRRKHHR